MYLCEDPEELSELISVLESKVLTSGDEAGIALEYAEDRVSEITTKKYNVNKVGVFILCLLASLGIASVPILYNHKQVANKPSPITLQETKAVHSNPERIPKDMGSRRLQECMHISLTTPLGGTKHFSRANQRRVMREVCRDVIR